MCASALKAKPSRVMFKLRPLRAWIRASYSSIRIFMPPWKMLYRADSTSEAGAGKLHQLFFALSVWRRGKNKYQNLNNGILNTMPKICAQGVDLDVAH